MVQKDYPPHKKMKEAVEECLQSAAKLTGSQHLQPAAVLYGSNQQPVDSWEMRKEGTEDVVIHAQAEETLQGMMRQFVNNQSSLAQSNAVLAAPRLRLVSANVVLLVVGKHTFRSATTDHFQRDTPTTARLASAMKVAGTDVAKKVDDLIERRHAAAHAESLEVLDEEVDEVRQLITLQLQHLCR